MKRIIACCDGTWNSPNQKVKGKPIRTNVELVYNFIKSHDSEGNVRQVKFYESGVGSSSFDIADKVLGGLKGLGIDKRIMDIYSFILMNYDEGDEVFLFGFSRGAYTARSVAGLIRNCGILLPKNIHLVEMAYGLYRDRNFYTSPESDFMVSFRNNYAVANITPIKFIGVWDTVGSLGLPLRFTNTFNREKYKFHDVKLSSYVQNAYHAVALDEHRSLFEPTLWEISPNSEQNNQKVEQRWFAGSHSNVGGGYPDTALSDLALEWLMSKAAECGLQFIKPAECELDGYKYNPDPDGILIDSRRFYYRLWMRKFRKIGVADDSEVKRLNARTNESIDQSVFRRYSSSKSRYKPHYAGKIFDRFIDTVDDVA